MAMDKTSISLAAVGSAVLTAVVVLIATNLVNSTGDSITAGQDAATVDLIKQVLKDETSVAVNGETLTTSEALSLILSNQATMNTEISVVTAQLEILTE